MIVPYIDKNQPRYYMHCKFCRGRARYYDEENDYYLCKDRKENCKSWKGYLDIPNQTCKTCGRPAKYYFPTSNTYYCVESYHNCPGTREERRQRQLKRYENSPNNILRRECAEGKHKCKYCGRPSTHLTPNGPCCVEKPFDCPNYHEWLSNVHKEKYKKNPELIERQREIGKEVHNRPEVIDKKSDAMIRLFHSDCDECKEFRKKREEAYKKIGWNYPKEEK